MKAIIMAGGRAMRLRPVTKEVPKSLIKLDVQGNCVIDAQIHALTKNGISEIVIITGHHADKIKDHLKKTNPETKFKFVHNQKYETTYPSYAFWVARKELEAPFIYLNGDVVFDPRILTNIIEDNNDSVTAIRKSKWDVEEVNVITEKDNSIIEIGKYISKKLSCGEFVGITKIGSKFNEKFIEALEFFINKKEYKRFAADAINLAIQNGQAKMYISNTGKLPAIEIDTYNDYREAQKLWEKIKKNAK